MPLAESELSEIIGRLETDFSEYVARMQVRRALIERDFTKATASALGVHIPKPYDESTLIIQTVVGEVVEGVQHYAARTAANPPQPIIPRIVEGKTVSEKVEKTAAEQERLLVSIWDSCGGAALQYQIAWAQSAFRVGWYLTLPADASWGLPDREYYDELSDEEIEELKRAGKVTPVPDEDGRFMESGEAWTERRREKAKDDALNARKLFTLEALPGDMVRARYDADGMKYGYVIEEIPTTDFAAGTELSLRVARHFGVTAADAQRFGVYLGSDGQVIAGVTSGGERDSQPGATFNLVRFFDREWSYYLVSASGSPSGGKVIWQAEHGAGQVPLVPVPGIRTGSRKPGAEYSSPMESVFAYAPLLNQVETLLSAVAAYNAIPRWVVQKADGSLLVDPASGEPKILVGETVPGLDPAQAQAIEGTVVQLKIDADLLLELLKVYALQMKDAMPSTISKGEGATSGPAWTWRQAITQAQEDLKQPTANHAAAVATIFRMWTRWLRLLDVPVYVVTAPRNRGQNVRGLIEFDPKDLVEWIEVRQSSNTASDRIVLQQHGMELHTAGFIDDETFFSDYALEDDPHDAQMRMWVQRLKAIVMGVGAPAPPNTVLAQVAQAVQGRLFLALMERAPNAALLQAELLAQQAQMQNPAQQGMTVDAIPTNMQPEAENQNVAAVNGLRQPGIGMGASLQGNPLMGEPNMGPR